MEKIIKSALIKCLLFALFISCHQDEKLQIDKQIQFSFAPSQLSSKGGRVKSFEIQSVMVSLRDNQGTLVADQKVIQLYKFGDNFLSMPLTLKSSGASNYHLLEFFVLDTNNNVVYVTPKEGSVMAHLVSDPLDIEFTVSSNEITTVSPEVVAIDSISDPAEYGYGQFGLKFVKTINTVFSAFVKTSTNFELTNAHIKIEGLADDSNGSILWTYETELAPKANKVVINSAIKYRITATKNDYNKWTRTLSMQEGEKTEILLEKSPDIYVAGYEKVASIQKAKYWKNGEPVQLSSNRSAATMIFVSENDVYVTGYEIGTNNNALAFYWKNGEKIILPQLGPTTTTGIFVSGMDVHVVGVANVNRIIDQVSLSVYVPVYWKNGIMQELPGSDFVSQYPSAETNYVTIDGSDVYITGWVSSKPSSITMFSQPVVWKNGQLVELSVPAGFDRSQAITVKQSNGHTYVSGIVGKSTDSNWLNRQAGFWVDGQFKMLGSSLSTTSVGLGLSVEHENVYVAGHETRLGNGWGGRYWKNEEPVLISPEGSVNLYSISVIYGEVYTAGDYQPIPSNGIPRTANYWVNGERVQCSKSNSFASSMFVAPK